MSQAPSVSRTPSMYRTPSVSGAPNTRSPSMSRTPRVSRGVPAVQRIHEVEQELDRHRLHRQRERRIVQVPRVEVRRGRKLPQVQLRAHVVDQVREGRVGEGAQGLVGNAAGACSETHRKHTERSQKRGFITHRKESEKRGCNTQKWGGCNIHTNSGLRQKNESLQHTKKGQKRGFATQKWWLQHTQKETKKRVCNTDVVVATHTNGGLDGRMRV
jgi:hypothetical protein